MAQQVKKKKSACNAGNTGDMSLIPGSGRSPGGGNGSPLQYSCLGNPMDSHSPKNYRAGLDWAMEHKLLSRLRAAICRCWVAQSCLTLCDPGGLACCSPWRHKESDTTKWLNWTELNWTELHARLPRLSLSPWVHSNSGPLIQWCHPNISSSVVPFTCLQSFPASRFLLRSLFFTSGGQSIGASASASVLPKNIQGWFPLGLTGLVSLLSKGLSRVFSKTTIQKHPFFSAQPSLWSNSHICTWLLGKP